MNTMQQNRSRCLLFKYAKRSLSHKTNKKHDKLIEHKRCLKPPLIYFCNLWSGSSSINLWMKGIFHDIHCKSWMGLADCSWRTNKTGGRIKESEWNFLFANRGAELIAVSHRDALQNLKFFQSRQITELPKIEMLLKD